MTTNSLPIHGLRFLFSLLCGLVVAGLSSCKDDNTNYLVHNDQYETKIMLTLDVVDEEQEYPDSITYFPESRSGQRTPALLPAIPEGYVLHYVVSAVNADGVLLKTIVTDEPDIVVNLSPGEFDLYAWADFIPAGNRSMRDYWYFTDEPSEMLLKEKYAYAGSEHAKRAFAGTKHISISTKSKSRSMEERVTLTPPMGRFRIVASKEAPYTVGRIKVIYKEGIWGGHNMLTDVPAVRWGNIAFGSYCDGSKDSELAFDHLFVAGGEPETFPMVIEVYDDKGKLRGRARNVRVPVKRGHVTTVIGDFFNILEEEPKPDDPNPGNGGIGINPGFDNTYIIIIS